MKLLILAVLVATSNGAPGGVVVHKTIDGNVGPYSDSPITFDAGNVGVNFGGYHASAGLGGLLTGDASKGGLHAEAGTPFGQEAGAGLGGTVDANGNPQIATYTYAHRGTLPDITEYIQRLGQAMTQTFG